MILELQGFGLILPLNGNTIFDATFLKVFKLGEKCTPVNEASKGWLVIAVLLSILKVCDLP